MNLSTIINPPPTQNKEPLPASGRAGRNPPAAIGVGVTLGAVALAAILVSAHTFMALVCLLVVVALWELAGAFARKDVRIPLIPLWVGGLGMLVCARYLGLGATLAALCMTLLACVVWRLLDHVEGSTLLSEILASGFALAYVPLLGACAVLVRDMPLGARAVIVFVLLTVANDLGGWAAGVLMGKHPMAPTVSPKKSWEGFAGSIGLSMIVGAIGFAWLGVGWWWGPVAAVLTTIAATIGDLTESLIKRDLGLKDMSNLLPGHGGVMDRLDSLLMVAPVFYVLMEVML